MMMNFHVPRISGSSPPRMLSGLNIMGEMATSTTQTWNSTSTRASSQDSQMETPISRTQRYKKVWIGNYGKDYILVLKYLNPL